MYSNGNLHFGLNNGPLVFKVRIVYIEFKVMSGHLLYRKHVEPKSLKVSYVAEEG